MRTFPRSITKLSACAALGLSCLVVSCADDPQDSSSRVPSFDEFKAEKYEAKLGRYIVEGDLTMSEQQLRTYYDRMVAQANKPKDGELGLLVGSQNDVDIIWRGGDATNLTYCVDKASFGTNYDTMVATVDAAAAAWEAHARVDFIHDASKDGNCNNSTDVKFNVTSFSFSDNTVASAFFPADARSERQVLVGLGAEGDTGVLTHELGHALGFRHENNRQGLRVSSAADCNGWEDSAWRALTVDDNRGSIMDCNTPYAGLTAEDIRGVACEYGDINGNLPGDCFIPGVLYRVHIAEFGWQGAVVNNDVAGSQGQGQAIQAVQIAQNRHPEMHICYQVHAAGIGWMDEQCDGATAGTVGEDRQLEAISVHLVNAPAGCSVSYQTHLADVGWTAAVSDGATSGTTGENRRLEALRVQLSSACL